MKPGWAFLGAIALNKAKTVILVLLTGHINYAPALAGGGATDFGGQKQPEVIAVSASSQPVQNTAPVWDPAGECAISSSFPQDVRQWCDPIMFYALQYDLHPDLLAALIWQESGGNSEAYSRSGAVGLMQVMPRDGKAASFNCINGPCFADRPSTADLWDPEYNISYGAGLLADLRDRQGNLRDALKSYGPMNVGYSYADKVLGLFQQYGQQP